MRRPPNAATAAAGRTAPVAEAIPGEIVARLLALAEELAGWVRDHRDSALAEQEGAVLAAVRSALPDLLGAVVRAGTSALVPGMAGARRHCPRCGRRARVDQWRTRRVRTACGEVAVDRPWYRCRPCRRGFSPVDETLALAPRARPSATLEAWVVRLGTATTFREAAAVLADLTGLLVAPDTVRAQSQRCGLALEAAQQAAIAAVQTAQEAAGAV